MTVSNQAELLLVPGKVCAVSKYFYFISGFRYKWV